MLSFVSPKTKHPGSFTRTTGVFCIYKYILVFSLSVGEGRFGNFLKVAKSVCGSDRCINASCSLLAYLNKVAK